MLALVSRPRPRTRARRAPASVWLTLFAASVGLLTLHDRARAQGGAEAAAQAARAADWAERQQRGDSAPSDRFRRVFIPGEGRVVSGTAAPAGPVRVPRKKSGAPALVGGLVLERGTRLPVPGVILNLVSTEPQYVIERFETRTDSSGYYEFKGVEPGHWALAVDVERVPETYAAPRAARVLAVSRKDSLAVPTLELSRTACVAGHAVWSDGYVFYDAPVVVAPRDTTLFAAEAMVNGIGDFQLCSAPTDSVMVWLVLRDGRRIGRSTRLATGQTARVGFTPEPLDKMDGTALRIQARTPEGLGVGRAQVVVVGRRFEQGDRPAIVFSREVSANQDGIAEVIVPPGTYEILVMNPREGQTGRVEQYVVAPGVPVLPALEVTVRGTTTAPRRADLRAELLDRAEQFLYLWTQ